ARSRFKGPGLDPRWDCECTLLKSPVLVLNSCPVLPGDQWSSNSNQFVVSKYLIKVEFLL
ncbi:hypothetical protein EWB00_006134, partial [Schistosoma japonicum]